MTNAEGGGLLPVRTKSPSPACSARGHAQQGAGETLGRSSAFLYGLAMDRIGDILRAHLQATELQLAAAEDGVEFSSQNAEDVPFIVMSKEELRSRVDTLREAL